MMRYHIVDGIGGQWLAEDIGGELSGIGLVDDILRDAQPTGRAADETVHRVKDVSARAIQSAERRVADLEAELDGLRASVRALAVELEADFPQSTPVNALAHHTAGLLRGLLSGQVQQDEAMAALLREAGQVRPRGED